MPKGGTRPNSGPKLRSTSKTITRSVRFTQDEWNEIVILSHIKEITPSEYIRIKVLEG